MSLSQEQKKRYCPNYDVFLFESKKKLQERLTHHHQLREPLIHSAVETTIAEIESLGYSTFIDETIPDYNASFIDSEKIESLLNDWDGPEISAKYVNNFHNPGSDGYKTVIGFDKYLKDAINWQDQSSYKVTGKYFFARHIKNIKQSYIPKYVNNICDDITDNTKLNIINYASIFCAVQLLTDTIQFRRSKQQPLIRSTTLRDSKELHQAFKGLYHALDIDKLKGIVKQNNKANPNKKGSNKYRINSVTFAHNLQIYARNLLQKERYKMGLCTTSVQDCLPQYFKEQSFENMVINSPIITPPKPPKPTIPLPPLTAYPLPNCVYNTAIPPKPLLHSDGSQTVFVPLRISKYGIPISNCYYPPTIDPNYGYYIQRGGQYIGVSENSRHSPYHHIGYN